MMKGYNINQTTLKILWLYANDYRKSLHVRAIARETGVDVKAIQLQLAKLEGVKVLTSFIRGKNKEYFLNLDNYITKHFMVMAESFASANYLANNFVIKRVISEVGDKLDGIVILFGSFAVGKQTNESDIDLFVVSEKELGSISKGAISEASSFIGREVSVRSVTRQKFIQALETGDPLVKEVVSNHIVLKGADGFCEVMWRCYAKR
jgi:predicted nucleotidyltransferase